MSSSGFLLSLVIDRPACWRVQALIVCFIVMGLAGVGLGRLPAPGRACAVLLILGSGLMELSMARPRSPRCVTRISMAPGGAFRVALGSDPGTLVPATVRRSWQLPGIAIGMAFATGDGRQVAAILFRDRVPPDAWRRLAVQLRHRTAGIDLPRLT